MAVSAVAVQPRTPSLGRLPSLSGAGFVVLVVAAFVGFSGNSPGAGASAAKVNAFYDAHQNAEFAASLIIAVASALLVIFGTRLAVALWPSDGTRRPFWQLFLGAASALAGAAWLVTAMLHFALTDAANQSTMSGGALQALNVLDRDSWIAFNSGLGVMMIGAGGALLARKSNPVLGWVALVAGVVLFIPLADFPALIVSGLWLITTSVKMFRRGAAFAGAA